MLPSPIFFVGMPEKLKLREQGASFGLAIAVISRVFDFNTTATQLSLFCHCFFTTFVPKNKHSQLINRKISATLNT